MPPDGFRKRKDGTTYPIHAPKRRGGVAVFAAGTALAMSATGGLGTGVIGGSAGSSALSTAESAVVRGIHSNLSKATRVARNGKPKQAWRRLGMRRGRPQKKEALECWALSFGQVQEFFAHTPCRDLRRVQFPVTSDNGNTIAVLVSRVRMHKAADATEFRRLIDEHGTGDIRPILPDVTFTGYHYDSDPRGKAVIVAEAEPRRGDPPEAVLQATAEAAAALAPR